MDWPSTLAALQQLDRSQAFTELAAALAALPHDPPSGNARAEVSYWRGKCAVVRGDHADAIAPLSVCTALQPARSHAHYLLGVGLARQECWVDAAAAHRQALALDPGLIDAARELAQAELALGNPAAALAALAPFEASTPTNVALQSTLWRARLREVSLEEGPGWITRALSQPQRLSDALLLEWIHVAAGLLLAGELQQAQRWLRALATATPDASACGHPLPRRPALLLGLIAELADTASASAAHCKELQLSFWLPSAELEQQLWHPVIQPALQLLIGRLNAMEAPFSKDARAALLVLADALKPLEPNGSEQAAERANALRQFATGAPHQANAGPERLLQHPSDLPTLLDLWPAVLEQDDPALLRDRGELDQALADLSALVLDRPNRLVIHPSSEAQALAQRLRQEGLEQLVSAHQRLATLLPALKPHARSRRRWLLLATNDLPQCFLYRVEQKRQQLEALGCECRIVLREALESWDWSEQLLWADAVVVCRLPALHPVLRAIHSARAAGLPVLYDIDDLIIDPAHCPPPFESYGGTLNPELHRRFHLDVPLFAAAIRACDGLIASTAALANRWRTIQGDPAQPIWVLPNLAPPELRRALTPPKSPTSQEPLRLVIASGTTAHKQAWQEELAPALVELMERHAHLRLDVLGHLQIPRQLQPYAARIRTRPYCDYARYLQQLSQAAIGLVVLEPGVFTDAKSAIRWMEFSYLGLASVLSPTATYGEALEDGVHALFARGQRQWVAQIEALIHDPQLRLRLARQAQAHAQQLFGPAQADRFWKPMLDPGDRKGSDPMGPRARKLLVAHVFYGPQSLGGATRVVLDQVRALQQHAPNRWEITVLCSDHTPWQTSATAESEPWTVAAPVPVQIHAWEGVRVVRLALPPRPWREHHDASVERLCRWWLAQESFDLIHAHCLQVLSAAPLQVAHALGIPYAVTLHDGWWLSPRQFLITASGSAVEPHDPLSHYDHPELQPEGALQRDRHRRDVLLDALAKASAIWAVSEAFAALHRQAGVAKVGVMTNRWQPMPAPPAPAPGEKPTSHFGACFIGGLSLHKGLAVLQAAVLQAHLPDPGLELTLVDAALAADAGYSLNWGTTPVRVIPAIAMDAMAQFYAEQDLLIAPSIWPESYGLVTREALSAGLWVIASDCGALAEPIRPGENGHIVPPRDARALAQVLENLCREHPSPQPLLVFSGGDTPLGQELDQHYTQLLQ